MNNAFSYMFFKRTKIVKNIFPYKRGSNNFTIKSISLLHKFFPNHQMHSVLSNEINRPITRINDPSDNWSVYILANTDIWTASR